MFDNLIQRIIQGAVGGLTVGFILSLIAGGAIASVVPAFAEHMIGWCALAGAVGNVLYGCTKKGREEDAE